MVWVDFLIIGIILVSTVISIVRGFVKEVFSLANWILASWVALSFYPHLAPLLTDYVATPSIRTFSAFTALFVVTLVLGALVNHLISQAVKKIGLSGIDRILGIIFGILRGVAIVTLLILAGGATQMPADDWWQNSLLLEHGERLAVWVQPFLPSDFADYINFNQT